MWSLVWKQMLLNKLVFYARRNITGLQILDFCQPFIGSDSTKRLLNLVADYNNNVPSN